MSDRHESNRKAWNEAAAYYRQGLEESIRFLREGGKHFCEPELRILGELLRGDETCIHLQCAGGTDTLSLINLGVREVVGVDISDEMIEVARNKSAALGMNARWYQSDVLKTPEELNGSADLVYTGRGALNWIMDIRAWASVGARLLKPGGHLYLFEGHPFTYFFDMNSPELRFDPEFTGYFSGKIYESQSWPDTYVGKLKASESEQATKFERTWPVSDIIQALLDAGLVLRRFEEHPDAYWKEFPNMPEQLRRRFPNTFSVLMQRP